MTADSEPHVGIRKKSLLDKYEIPVSHLDFDYIKNCTDSVELARIIRILRSNEEGCYPELLRSTEERLGHLAPNHKALRVSTPVITKRQLSDSERRALEEELSTWKDEVSAIEKGLNRRKDMPETSSAYPQVRRTAGLQTQPSECLEETKSKRAAGTDYRKWDMFDADSECLRMELAEEKADEERRRKELEEKKRMEKESHLSLEEKEIQTIAATVEVLSQEEREVLGLKEKELGNEFYQSNRLDNALRHYTRSICLHPTPVAYNNRAATYLKQCRFSKALEDLNVVLEMDPNNVKAHYRRAVAYQHKNEFHKALDDILEVLKHEPKHVLARHIADQLRENCSSLPRKLRIKVQDEKNPAQLIVKEIEEDELKRDYKDIDYLEVNDNDLPKIMCNCNGKYTNDPIMKSNDPLKYQHTYHRGKYSEKIMREVVETERNGKRVPSLLTVGSGNRNSKPLIETASTDSGERSSEGKRLEIVELEKVEEEKSERFKSNNACVILDKRSKAESHKTKDEKMTFNKDMQAIERTNREINPSQQPSQNCKEDELDGKVCRSPPLTNEEVTHLDNEGLSDIISISRMLFPAERLMKCSCGEGYKLRPQQFISKWQGLEKSPKDRGRLVRLLCPHQLPSVIGTNLDAEILSGFIACLSNYFDLDTEKDRIIKYLEYIARLQRFRIIATFLSSKDKAVASNLLKKLQPTNNNIEEAFVQDLKH